MLKKVSEQLNLKDPTVHYQGIFIEL